MRKLLVADDTEDIRVLLRLVLSGSFEIIAEATDGAEALADWQSNRDDVFALVLDYRMPRMTGLDVARRVLAEDPTARIVLFSANISEELVAEAEAAGVTAVVHKEQLPELAGHAALAA